MGRSRGASSGHSGDSRVLEDSLGGRDNALNFVRFVLASIVIFGHSPLVTGMSGVGDTSAKLISYSAVNAFFVISGYLIFGSRMRLEFLPYIWRRILRIMPAFWVCLTLTALVIAPLSTLLTKEVVNLNSALSYVYSNLSLHMNQITIDQTLQTSSVSYWNGSLWTLQWEFLCYLLVGAAFSIPFCRRHPKLLSITLLLLGVFSQLAVRMANGNETNDALHGIRLITYFAAGMVFWSYRERIRLSFWVAIPALMISLALSQANIDLVNWTLGPVPLAYSVLWIGATLPIRWWSVNDISYGIYIYAFPIQQFINLYGVSGKIGIWGSAVLALLITMPIAGISWIIIEKRALKHAKFFDKSRLSSIPPGVQ